MANIKRQWRWWLANFSGVHIIFRFFTLIFLFAIKKLIVMLLKRKLSGIVRPRQPHKSNHLRPFIFVNQSKLKRWQIYKQCALIIIHGRRYGCATAIDNWYFILFFALFVEWWTNPNYILPEPEPILNRNYQYNG